MKEAGYQERSWEEIRQLWYSLNRAVCIVGRKILENPTTEVLIEGKKETSQFLVEDYYRHMAHHMDQIVR